jgi:hypothetical protein
LRDGARRYAKDFRQCSLASDNFCSAFDWVHAQTLAALTIEVNSPAKHLFL